MQTNSQPDNYMLTGGIYQLALPIDVAVRIPADDSVRLLNAVFERMNYAKLYAAYSRMGGNKWSPKTLFKIVVYGYMNGIYSTRELERACQRDINFMFLLSGGDAPDHSTIARFRSERLTGAIEDLFVQLVDLLEEAGELSLAMVFIDGTKLEANANRYSFVWRKTTQTNEAKMQEKMKVELPKLAEEFGLRFYVGERIEVKHLKKMLKHLYALKGSIKFVHGKGRRKQPLQRAIEAVEAYLARQRQYDEHNRTFGDRNSFSKIDKDATFMRMKEDHMRNGQLKPAYNATLAVDAEYIVGAMISQERSDAKTFIPVMEKLISRGYTKPVADAGYESEENYTWCEENGQIAFIKPSNHDQAKTKKYKSDIGRRENMAYDAESDTYTCHDGRKLKPSFERNTNSKSGYPIVTTVYSGDCAGCSHKARCIKGRSDTPLEQRNKNLHVSKRFQRQRAAAEQRINTDEGMILRRNRSIQVEGAFGVLKQDMGFRRFLLRGQVKVQTELLLLAMAFNVNKLHNKIQNGRCGAYLHVPKAA